MNRKMILLSALLVLFAVGSEMPSGCGGTISGTITDGATTGMVGVEVSVSSDSVMGVIAPTTTDGSGNYSFTDMPAGNLFYYSNYR